MSQTFNETVTDLDAMLNKSADTQVCHVDGEFDVAFVLEVGGMHGSCFYIVIFLCYFITPVEPL